MSRILWIARREWLEQRRQPVMLAAIATLHLVIGGLTVALIGMLDWLIRNPQGTDLLVQALGPGREPVDLLRELGGSALGLYAFLAFTQSLGISSVLAGHAVLHDRQCGTLSFLLLAPVNRTDLLVGKVLGAIGWPVALHLAIDGVCAALCAATDLGRAHPAWVPLSGAWWVAHLLTGPAWALFLGAVCTLVSSAARDVRTAQQGVWFVMFFATLGAGLLLTWSLPAGLGVQLGVLAFAATGAAATLAVGAQWISRDLGR